jgi:cell division protein FtsB
MNYLLLFVTVVLVVDALIGDKGFMDTLRVRRESRALARSVEALRQENARLLERRRRLKEDPATLESIARKEHGMIRPGEILFILKDVKPASHSTPSAQQE